MSKPGLGSTLLGWGGGLITFAFLFNATAAAEARSQAEAAFALALSGSGAVYVGRRLAYGRESLKGQEQIRQYGPPTYRR